MAINKIKRSSINIIKPELFMFSKEILMFLFYEHEDEFDFNFYE